MEKNVDERSVFMITADNMDFYEKNIFSRVHNQQELEDLLIRLNIGQAMQSTISQLYFLYSQFPNKWLKIKIERQPGTLKIKNKTAAADIKNTIIAAQTTGQKVGRVIVYLDQEDIEGIESLDDLHLPIYIYMYEELYSIEEYLTMKSTFDYYHNLIISADLSPLEKIAYAYDLIKSFSYRESNQKEVARSIKGVIETGNIVCVGFSKMLGRLLTDLGVNCFTIYVDDAGGHERTMCEVHDSKYGINGMYVLDATFDGADNEIFLCQDENGQRVYRDEYSYIEGVDKKIKRFDGLMLYKYFLIPASQYGNKFHKKAIKTIKSYSTNQQWGNETLYRAMENAVISIDGENLSLEAFIELIYNVKLSEGYKEESIVELINDILRINRFSEKDEFALIERVINEINQKKYAA